MWTRVVRAVRAVAPVAVLLAAAATPVLGQGASGKVEGTVRDQAGAPIANAQVFIVGTTYSATTNNEGYYFINNVPAGTVQLQASFIGYKRTRLADVRVFGGQTITQDIALEATPFEVEEITVVAAVNPLVPRDEVTTKQRLDGNYTKKLPVDRVSNVLALQPGVVASQGSGSLFVRGGRADEAAIYIDGVPATSGARNSNAQSRVVRTVTNPVDINAISTNSFEEASITTGGSAAEFGNAQSGIIAIQTRSGGSAWSGSLGYETDDAFSTQSSLGFNRITGSLSGPVANNLTFFLGGDLEGRASAQPGKGRADHPVFVAAGRDTVVNVPSVVGSPTADTTAVEVQRFAVYTGECDAFGSSVNSGIASNYGFDCRGIRLPSSAASSYRLNGNLNYSYGTGSRVKASAIWRDQQNRVDYEVLNPQNQRGQRGWNRIYTLNWMQNLSKSAERALALEAAVSYQQDRYILSPMTLETDLDTYAPFGGFMLTPMKFVFNFDNFPIDETLVENYKLNKANSRRSTYDLENSDQYENVARYRTNPYGLASLFNEDGGPDRTIRFSMEDRLIGKASLDWQVDRYNRVKFGGEYTDYKLTEYNHNQTAQAFSDVYIEKPVAFNAFIQDRLDLGDVVLEGGLRYDWYDSKAERPYLLDLTPSSPTFNEYVYFPRTASYRQNNNTAPDGRPLTITRADQSHGYLSPHIQVSFPVTRSTNFRLSYAHQVQQPDLSLIYSGINTDLSVTNTNHVYGQDLDFGRTITFEFGIRHSFNPDMVLDIAAYNKDNLSNAAGRLVTLQDPLNGRTQDLRLLTNADFGNVKGIDVRIDRRFGALFNGTLAYTFENAKNTGSDPFTYIDFGSRIVNQVSGGNQPPPQSILPTDNSRPHNLAGSFSLQFPNSWREGTGLSWLENVGAFATFRFASGTAFTRCPDESGNENVRSGGVCARQFEGDPNGARLPMFKQFDLRLVKGFNLSGVDVTAYLDVRNLFNFKNIAQVFAVTNDVRNAQREDQVLQANLDGFAREGSVNGAVTADGALDLSFGTGGCADWVDQAGTAAAPSCVYLIRAEQRYGNGDGVFTLAEQTSASEANYLRTTGLQAFTGAGRWMRLGFEFNF